jgi:hypothetical protein
MAKHSEKSWHIGGKPITRDEAHNREPTKGKATSSDQVQVGQAKRDGSGFELGAVAEARDFQARRKRVVLNDVLGEGFGKVVFNLHQGLSRPVGRS